MKKATKKGERNTSIIETRSRIRHTQTGELESGLDVVERRLQYARRVEHVHKRAVVDLDFALHVTRDARIGATLDRISYFCFASNPIMTSHANKRQAGLFFYLV